MTAQLAIVAVLALIAAAVSIRADAQDLDRHAAGFRARRLPHRRRVRTLSQRVIPPGRDRRR